MLTGWLWDSRWKSAACILMASLMAVVPVSAMAQTSSQESAAATYAEACAAAEMDAEAATNKTLWLGAGCCLWFTGVILAYVITPTPPASKVMGKSPQYVTAYNDCYRERAKKIQTNKLPKVETPMRICQERVQKTV